MKCKKQYGALDLSPVRSETDQRPPVNILRLTNKKIEKGLE